MILHKRRNMRGSRNINTSSTANKDNLNQIYTMIDKAYYVEQIMYEIT